jgi:hypothetical protein
MLIIIAIINTKSRVLRMAEFSFTAMPKIRSIPATNSIQGKAIARKLIVKSGISL